MSNENYEYKIENIRLKKEFEILNDKNKLWSQAENLARGYRNLLNIKNEEIEILKDDNIKLKEAILKLPKFIKKIFLKDY